ncbi:hypothetical protein MmTuc01_3429 [Methanosarcina mazei Tuc01]|uniref:Uncharacterized protein n=1 Tax=Methanosarcina mazei Tuc01 TaxID=1236903 RepID=M1QEJ7_METMZ|nr:hypothetical protein MmTuc01_3429 [Methanosarcina mazei Tuc01]
MKEEKQPFRKSQPFHDSKTLKSVKKRTKTKFKKVCKKIISK